MLSKISPKTADEEKARLERTLQRMQELEQALTADNEAELVEIREVRQKLRALKETHVH